MKLSIIIPAYNERKSILNVLDAVKKVSLPDEITEREIIVIDDYSNDGTREILKKISDLKIKVIYHEENKGKGRALSTGFKRATGDIVIIQDADLEYDPNEYPKLLKPILDDKADVVFGSRFIGGESRRILYFWHAMLNRCLTFLSNIFSDLNLTDMETCYKVFRKDVLDQIRIEENGFGFEPEITAKVGELSRIGGVRLYEVGISYYGRTYDDGKKIGWKDGLRALWCIYKYNTSWFARAVKYVINGLLIVLSQLLVVIYLVEFVHLNTEYLKNVANIISVIVGLLIAFVLHSYITWNYRFSSGRDVLRKLVMFYLVSSASILVRVLVFYFFNLKGMDYRFNTLIGIVLIVVINFFGYDRLFIKKLKLFEEDHHV